MGAPSDGAGCPACEGRGTLPDGADCPKCRAQAMVLEGESAGALARVFDAAMLALDEAGRAVRNGLVAGGYGLVLAGLVALVGFALRSCALELMGIIEFSRGIGSAGLVPLVILTGIWSVASVVKVGVPAAAVRWTFRWAKRNTHDEAFAGRAPLHVDQVRAEVRELHGRPGVAAFVELRVAEVRAAGRLELHLRLDHPDGRPVGSRLGSFADGAGALRIRTGIPPSRVQGEVQLERGAFAPLAALDLPPDSRPRELVARLLVFADGWLRAEARCPVVVTLTPAEGIPALGPGEGAGIEVMAARILATEARCPVCGDVFGSGEGEALVSCSGCETPHHEECWAFAGQCSTYSCGGEARRGAGGGAGRPAPTPAVARPVASVAAWTRLRSWIPPRVRPGCDWRVTCPGCGAAARIDGEGRCPACRRPLAAEIALAAVPARERSWDELPWVAGPLALAEAGGPFLVAVLASVTLGSDVALAGVGAVALLLGWRGLVGPIERGLARWNRIRPPGELRSFTADFRVRAARVSEPWAGGTAPAALRLVLLARGTHPGELRVLVRIRGPGGYYLQSMGGSAQGEWAELCAAEPLPRPKDAAPALGVLDLGVPLDSLRLPAGDPGNPLVAEVLFTDGGTVVAEADVDLGSTRGQGGPGRPAAGVPAASLEWLARARPGPEPLPCAMCAEPLGRVGERCTGCRALLDAECVEFLGSCPVCGGSGWLSELLGQAGGGAGTRPRKRSGLG